MVFVGGAAAAFAGAGSAGSSGGFAAVGAGDGIGAGAATGMFVDEMVVTSALGVLLTASRAAKNASRPIPTKPRKWTARRPRAFGGMLPVLEIATGGADLRFG